MSILRKPIQTLEKWFGDAVPSTKADDVLPAVSKADDADLNRAEAALITPFRGKGAASQNPYDALQTWVEEYAHQTQVRHEWLLQTADEVFEIDPTIGIVRRQQATRESLTLRHIAGLARIDPIENPDIVRLGTPGLIEEGLIKLKKKKGAGYMLTPAGKQALKEQDVAAAALLSGRTPSEAKLTQGLIDFIDLKIAGLKKVEVAGIAAREEHIVTYGIESWTKNVEADKRGMALRADDLKAINEGKSLLGAAGILMWRPGAEPITLSEWQSHFETLGGEDPTATTRNITARGGIAATAPRGILRSDEDIRKWQEQGQKEKEDYAAWQERLKTLEEGSAYERGKYLEGGIISKATDILSTLEYASGGILLSYRQLKERQRQEGTDLSIGGVKRVLTSLAVAPFKGIKHRISPSKVLEVEGTVKGIGTDIALDPSTYGSLGIIPLIKHGGGALVAHIAKVGGKKAAKEAAAKVVLEGATPATKVEPSKAVIIDADLFKKQFDDYDPANRPIYSKMAGEEFTKQLKINENPVVHFTAGGPGSGKSEGIIKGLTEVEGFDGIIKDGVLSDFDKAVKKIDEAENAGKDVIISSVLPRIQSARKYVLKREIATGRGVPLDVFVDKHVGSINTLIEIIEKLPSVEVRLKDVRNIYTKKEVVTAPFITNKQEILDILKGVKYNIDELTNTLSKTTLSHKAIDEALQWKEEILKYGHKLTGTERKNKEIEQSVESAQEIFRRDRKIEQPTTAGDGRVSDGLRTDTAGRVADPTDIPPTAHIGAKTAAGAAVGIGAAAILLDSEGDEEEVWEKATESGAKEERVDDGSLWAPTPKGPLEKEEGGTLSKIFGVLLTGERASGSLIYAARKRTLGEIDWIEEREAGEWFKEISPSQALGISTSETKFLSARGVTAFALDILLDPTTYIGVGIIGKGAKVAKGIPKALRIGRSTGKDITVGPLGIQYLEDTIARGISRETAEKKLIATIERGHTDYLAAKKFSESSVHLFGQKLFYTAPYTKVAKAGWDALPYAQKRAKGVDLLKTAVVPYHKAIQDVGEEVKKPFLHFYRHVAYQKAKIRTSIKEISETTSKAQTRDVAAILDKGTLHLTPEEQAAKAAAHAAGEPRPILPEREISHEARTAAADLRKIYDDAFEEKVLLGMIKEDQYRKQYMHHTLTKEGRKFIKEKHGGDIDQFTHKQGSSYQRTMEGSVSQINKMMRDKHGIKQFFIEDPYEATQIYLSKHVASVESYKLHQEIITKYGQPTGFPAGQAPDTVIMDGIPQTLFKYTKEKKSGIPTTFARSELSQMSPTEYTRAEAYIPTSLAKELQATYPKHTWWTETYDPTLSALKKSWISVWPGYYARNLQGGVGWQNILAGVEPTDYARNVDILYGDPTKVYDIPLYGKKTGAELKELMESHNVYGQTGYIGEPSTQSVTGVLSKAYEKYPQHAMHLSENQLRGPVFLHYFFKTGDADYAAAMVYKFHFEYLKGTYTHFEEDFLYRAFPFGKWPRGNIPLQSEMIVRQPGTYAALAKWQEMGTTPEEYNKQPDWQKEQITYVAGDTTISFDIPAMDLPGLYGPEDVFFGLTPFAKMGIYGFSGIDQHGRRMDSPLTLQGAAQHAEMTALTLEGRYLYAAREAEKTRTGERPISHTVVHQLAGVGVSESPSAAQSGREQRSTIQLGRFSVLTQFRTKRTKAVVARVIDGDTIVTEDGETIRLLGIDTAERGEPTYHHAKLRLEELVLGKEVSLESSVEDKGVYGRQLRYVFRNGKNINLQMVEEGYAPASYKYQDKKYKEEIEEAERIAREGEIGPLWNLEVRAALRTFETASGHTPQPTKKQKEAAWNRAGRPDNFRTKTLQTSPTMELVSLTNEDYEAAQGFEPTEEQLQYILTPSNAVGIDRYFPDLAALRSIFEPAGAREARYEELVKEWQAFKSGAITPEQPTQAQRMESWRRAGFAPGDPYEQKIYRDEAGKLIGVATFTPDEIEEMGGYKMSKTEAEWAFRDTATMLPKEQAKRWAQEHAEEEQRKERLEEELVSLRTIKIEKGEDIPDALRIGGVDKLMARRRELEDMLGTGVDR